ncbi:helix-turn-helix domain-containing protein, partial [Vibrio parahaemolyticus]|uniref:helix-turn-helix domain-containing protein n=1 Tax=Vibrio parahaemolyticus TaxID=670 RepID=UPI002016535B
MSDKDLSRYKVINDVCEYRLRRADAAEILNLSERQVQHLMNRLQEPGVSSLVHGARGKPSNNRISSDY